MKTYKKPTHDYSRMSHKMKKKGFGFINFPAAFWKSWHPNIYINAACFFFPFFVLMSTAQMANSCLEASQQQWFTSREAVESVCVFLTEVCVCVIVCFSWGPPVWLCYNSHQDWQLPIINLEQPQVTEAIDLLHQGIDWYQATKWNMHGLS